MRAILTYHSIDDSGSAISCSRAAFADHVSWLASGRVRVTTVDQLLTLEDDADAVAVTFDDGLVNFRDEAAARLLDHRFPVALFVVADRVGQTNVWDNGSPMPLLDWPDLIRLQDQGVTLGAHSRTHRRLSGLSLSELESEVRGCADLIERQAGRRPTGFAYPYGDFDRASKAAVAREFGWACTTKFQPLSLDSEPFGLPRLDMFYFQAPGSLDGWGTRSFRARLNLRHGLRRARSLSRNLGAR